MTDATATTRAAPAATPAAGTGVRFPWRTFLLVSLIVSMWIHASEHFRYMLFVRPMLMESLAMVPGVAPMNLPVFLSWGAWNTMLAAMTVLTYWFYAQVFGAGLRAVVIAGTLSWLSSFVFFWHAFVNLNLATLADLFVEPPMSWVELVVASFIARAAFASPAVRRLARERP